MFRRWLLVCLPFLVSSALAQQISPTELNRTPPKSIWDIDLDGTAVNPQSQLTCPAVLAGFRRNEVESYSPVGLDVSCNYRGPAGVVTVYLARYGDKPTPEQYFESAKQAVKQHTPDAVERDDVPAGPAGLDWIRGGFVVQDGKLNSDLWVAADSDWVAQIRASYPPDAMPAIKSFMGAYSEGLAKATERLAACAKSPPPERKGKMLSGESVVLPLVITGSARALDVLSKPETDAPWCAETGFGVSQEPYLFWRNIAAGETGILERITPIDGGDTIFILNDPAGPKAAEKVTKLDAVYDAVSVGNDTLSLIGVFDARPPLQSLVRFLAGPHGVYASADRNTKKISIYANAFASPMLPPPP